MYGKIRGASGPVHRCGAGTAQMVDNLVRSLPGDAVPRHSLKLDNELQRKKRKSYYYSINSVQRRALLIIRYTHFKLSS